MIVIMGDESNVADLEEQEAIRPMELARGVSLSHTACAGPKCTASSMAYNTTDAFCIQV